MIKLFLKLFCLFTLVSASFVSLFLAEPSAFIPRERLSIKFTSEIAKGKFIVSKPKYLIVGDSTARSNLKSKFFTRPRKLANNSSSWVETYLSVENYLKNQIPPEAVVVSVLKSSTSLSRSLEYFVSSGYFSLMDFFEFYSLCVENSACKLTNYDKVTSIFKFFFEKYGLTAVGLKNLRKFLIRPSFSYEKINKIERNILSSRDLLRRRKANYKIIKTQRLDYADYFRADPVNMIYLKRLLALLNDRKIPLYYIQMPLNERYLNDDEKNLVLSSRKIIANEILKFEANEVWWQPLTLPDELFVDTHHFSKKGAIKFRANILPYCKNKNRC